MRTLKNTSLFIVRFVLVSSIVLNVTLSKDSDLVLSKQTTFSQQILKF